MLENDIQKLFKIHNADHYSSNNKILDSIREQLPHKINELMQKITSLDVQQKVEAGVYSDLIEVFSDFSDSHNFFKEKEFIRILNKAKNDPTPSILWALESFGFFDENDFFKKNILSVFSKSPSKLKVVLMELLSFYDHDKHSDLFLIFNNCFDDPNEEVKFKVAEEFLFYGVDSDQFANSLRHLQKWLDDPSWKVRLRAAQMLSSKNQLPKNFMVTYGSLRIKNHFCDFWRLYAFLIILILFRLYIGPLLF